ncbi:MAG TPA: glycosyltransferase family 4 protein [Planctomycetota bacterium]|nr:glycosyltransferase family 4 protein [Planctomycetota bacterium]
MSGRPRLNLMTVTLTTAFDGPERQVLHLARRLDPKRWRPRHLSLREPGDLTPKLQHADVQVLPGGVKEEGAEGGWVDRFADVYRLTRLLRRAEVDVVMAFGFEADVRIRKAARMAAVPVVVGSYREHRPPDDPWAARSRRTASLVDVWIAPTEALAAEAVARAGAPGERVRIVPPAIDLVETAGMTRADDLLEPKERVGALLRLDARKGVDVLLDAAARLKPDRPDLEWVVCGGGPEAMTWLRRVQRAGLEGTVVLKGSRNDRGAVFAGVDVFVAPGRVEGLSAALLEAAGARRPCVAADNPSVRAAFADGVDALITPPGDAGALAAAVARLLEDRALAERLGAAAKARAAEYRVERAVVALHDVLEEAVAGVPLRR